MMATPRLPFAWISRTAVVALLLAVGACAGEPQVQPTASGSAGAADRGLENGNAAYPTQEGTYLLPDGVEVEASRVQELLAVLPEAYKVQQEGDPAGCAARLAAMLAVVPNHAENHFYRGCCLALAGRPDEAVAALAKAVDHGYLNGEQMASDEDLASLRGRADFRAVVTRAEEAFATVLAADPMAGPVDESGPHAGLDELLARFEEDPLGPAAALITGRAEIERGWRRGRSKIHALRGYARAHPREAARAELEALRQMAAFFPAAPDLGGAVESFLARYGEGPLAGEALMLAARTEHGSALDDPGHPGHAAAVAAVTGVARGVIERFPDGEGSREAYLWLTRKAIDSGDQEGMRRGYAALRKRWPEDEAFWSRHRHALVPARLLAVGLPDFAVASLDGDLLSPEALRGRVALLDFWATWCVPCVEQFPHLKRLYAAHRGSGFEIVGFSGDAAEAISRQRLDAWLAKHQIPWPIFFDGTGWGNEVYQAFGVQGIPLTVLLDRQGNIAGANLPPEKLEEAIASLL